MRFHSVTFHSEKTSTVVDFAVPPGHTKPLPHEVHVAHEIDFPPAKVRSVSPRNVSRPTPSLRDDELPPGVIWPPGLPKPHNLTAYINSPDFQVRVAPARLANTQFTRDRAQKFRPAYFTVARPAREHAVTNELW